MNASCGPRLVVISGVTSGIGRALALTFAQRDGFIVAGCGRRSEELATLLLRARSLLMLLSGGAYLLSPFDLVPELLFGALSARQRAVAAGVCVLRRRA